MDFIRFGCFTFGGGWSIIAQMRQLYVEKRQVITDEELLDLTSVARSLPGIMIGNVAMLYGYRVAGLVGGLMCVLGMVIPPMMILICISFFYNAFRSSYWVTAAMEGMQAAVVPIIAGAALGMVKGSVKYSPCVIVVLASFALYIFFQVSAVYLVLMGVAAGLLIGEYYERKEAGGNGAA
ncbi:MAG: chromate transporter [Faecousia sp.]